MKFAFASVFDSQDVRNWSGTPYYMSHALQTIGSVDYLGNLKRKLPLHFKLVQSWKKLSCGQRESPRFNITAARFYSEQIAEQLKNLKVDVVISPQVNPIAYLDCKEDIILWTDGLYASLIGFYPGFSAHSASSIEQGNKMTKACLARCRYAVFSSDWAARTAIEIYGTNPDKVKVIPFGANIQQAMSFTDVQQMIKARCKDTLKLLFLGKHWDRKGGETVFAVAKALHAAKQKVELHFVGCMPPKEVVIPSYIHCPGFISKKTPEGLARLTQLFKECHFLFVPSRAEAYGIVFCEANAFGLPCLTTHIGGIPTVVRNNVNGMTFALDAPVENYCQYLMSLMENYSAYEELALSSFNEYKTRLNWDVAVGELRRLL